MHMHMHVHMYRYQYTYTSTPPTAPKDSCIVCKKGRPIRQLQQIMGYYIIV